MAETTGIPSKARDMVHQLRLETNCRSESSTVRRCNLANTHSSQEIKRIDEITTRLEEISVLIFAYKLKYMDLHFTDPMRDSLAERAHTLSGEIPVLIKEAGSITDEPLVSKLQAAANRVENTWYADASGEDSEDSEKS